MHKTVEYITPQQLLKAYRQATRHTAKRGVRIAFGPNWPEVRSFLRYRFIDALYVQLHDGREIGVGWDHALVRYPSGRISVVKAKTLHKNYRVEV